MVQVRLSGVDVALYVAAVPPVPAGVMVTVACVLPAVTDAMLGASGAAADAGVVLASVGTAAATSAAIAISPRAVRCLRRAGVVSGVMSVLSEDVYAT
jgi:hypothetical protein